MRVTERAEGEIAELQRLASAESHALRRDRYRAVLLALSGKEAVEIAHSLGRGRRNVQDWVYAYRDGGIDAIQPKPRKGRVPLPDGTIRDQYGNDITKQYQDGMASDGAIYLQGCQTGRGDNSAAQNMSTILPGRKVAGGAALYMGRIGTNTAVGRMNYFLNGKLLD